jgi:hypothetical protein
MALPADVREVMYSVAAVALVAGFVVVVGVAVYDTQRAPDLSAEATLDADDDALELTHAGGASLSATDLEFVLERPDAGERVRLLAFPAAENDLADRHVDGDPVVDRVAGAVSRAEPDTDGTWSEGEAVRFSLTDGVDPGDVVVVEVTHVPTGKVVYETRVEAA